MRGALVRRSNAQLLIVGLAPGMQGANRTGRPFTGDYAGDLLYATCSNTALPRASIRPADDGLRLVDCRISNAVRCVPPQNKPLPTRSTPAGIPGRDDREPCRSFARSWRSARSRMIST
jgi:uracil-DNA glycosylase